MLLIQPVVSQNKHKFAAIVRGATNYMGERLRCAVIGIGSAGLEIINSLLHCPRATVVAIAETNPQRAREVCERFKIPRNYAAYPELLDQPDIDAVAIALPNQFHAKAAVEALKARKHVLLERPAATNAKDAAKLVETVRAMKRTFMVSQELRFHRSVQLAKTIIQRGELGELYHARAFWLRRNHIPRIGSWHTQKQQAGGGCASDLGQSMLDLCLHLLGDFTVTSVTAQTLAKFGPRGLGDHDLGRPEIVTSQMFDVEDIAAAFLRLKNGRTITLEVCWAGHLPADAREQGLDLLGTSAGLSLFPARMFRPGPNGYDCTLLGAPKVTLPEDRVHHFVQCVLENKKPLVTPEESLAVQKIMDALYASAASGKEVYLK
jgi:predicted dehydrogenase